LLRSERNKLTELEESAIQMSSKNAQKTNRLRDGRRRKKKEKPKRGTARRSYKGPRNRNNDGSEHLLKPLHRIRLLLSPHIAAENRALREREGEEQYAK